MFIRPGISIVRTESCISVFEKSFSILTQFSAIHAPKSVDIIVQQLAIEMPIIIESSTSQ